MKTDKNQKKKYREGRCREQQAAVCPLQQVINCKGQFNLKAASLGIHFTFFFYLAHSQRGRQLKWDCAHDI